MTYGEAVYLLKQGNESGFQYLYDTTYKSCLYVIGEIVKDSMEAEDILQDAYMNAISKIDTLKDPEKFPSWFRTMASHLAINRVNKNKRVQTINPGEDETPESVMDRMVNEKSANNQITPEEAYECRETSMLLHELIDELPEEQRQCILLYYMEEYSIKDIADVCKCSENTIKSRLNYGKKKLEEKTIELQKKGYVLRGVTPVYLITWLLKTDMGYKLKFVYGGAATSAFSHTLFTKLVNAGIVTAVNSGLTNAVGSGMNNTVQSGMTNMVNSGMTTAAGEAVTGGTAAVNGGTTAGSAVAGTAAKGVASTAVKGGIHTLAGKIITGALITVIAGGLVTAGVVTIVNNNKTEDEMTMEATSEEVTTELTTTEITTELTTEVTTEEVTTITSGNVMTNDEDVILGDIDDEDEIKTITFLDTLDEMPSDAWDISDTGNASVMAWATDSGDEKAPYNLYIAGDGGVDANENSYDLFGGFSYVEEFNFNDCFYTVNCTDMGNMFISCSSLVSLDCSSFDTSNVTNMNGMFSDCRDLTNLDVSSFDTSNVKNMGNMFASCDSLTSLDVSNFDTSNVENMELMFYECELLTNLDISNFNTGSVTDMEDMFCGCKSLTSLDVSNFDTWKVTNMFGMFRNCSSLTSLDLSNFNTGSVKDMCSMFDDCSSLASLDVSSFNTSHVVYMRYMFSGCSSLTSLDLTSFNTSSATDMRYMFSGCSSLTDLKTSSGFTTSNVETEQIDGAEGMYSGTNLQ